MKVSKDDFTWAASEGLISAEQAEALWRAFENRLQNEKIIMLIEQALSNAGNSFNRHQALA